jgi:hypothetical protein
MKNGILAVSILVLCAVASGESWNPADFAFPADPSGVTVIDRDYIREFAYGGDLILYAILYSRDGLESMDILSGAIGPDGIEWVLVQTWAINFDGRPVDIEPNAVLTIDPLDDRITFSYKEDFLYMEGRASIYLDYFVNTGVYEAGWVD